jgi:hypothetical protein
MKAYRVCKIQLHYFLNLTLIELSVELHAPAALDPEETPISIE